MSNIFLFNFSFFSLMTNQSVFERNFVEEERKKINEPNLKRLIQIFIVSILLVIDWRLCVYFCSLWNAIFFHFFFFVWMLVKHHWGWDCCNCCSCYNTHSSVFMINSTFFIKLYYFCIRDTRLNIRSLNCWLFCCFYCLCRRRCTREKNNEKQSNHEMKIGSIRWSWIK